MLIAAVDAAKPANVGWAANDGGYGAGSLTGLIDRIAAAIERGDPVAIGIEAPLWIPLGRRFEDMTRSRGGIEQTLSRAWSAGAGTGALAAGAANLGWLLEQLAAGVGPRRITTQDARFRARGYDLLIWEAFVSGAGKGIDPTNHGDAMLAVEAFAGQWPALRSLVPPSPAVNLAWAVACSTGHQIAPDESQLAVPVIGPSAPLKVGLETRRAL